MDTLMSSANKATRSTGKLNDLSTLKAQRSLDTMNKSLKSMEKQASSTKRMMMGMIASVGAGMSVTALARTADSYKNMTNKLMSMGQSTGEARDTLLDLSDVAARTRTPLADMASLYAKASLAANDLGASQADIMQFTENIGNALGSSGTSATSAAGALLQLGQALGGTLVQAEEFNSILDGSFAVAQAAADGIEAAGGSVAKLNRMVKDQKVTPQMLYQGIMSQSEQLAEKMGKTTSTIGQAFEVLRNRWTLFIGTLDLTYGVSTGVSNIILRIADAVNYLARNMELIEIPIKTFLTLLAVIPLMLGFMVVDPIKAKIAEMREAFDSFLGGNGISFEGLKSAFSNLKASFPGTMDFAGNLFKQLWETIKLYGAGIGDSVKVLGAYVKFEFQQLWASFALKFPDFSIKVKEYATKTVEYVKWMVEMLKSLAVGVKDSIGGFFADIDFDAAFGLDEGVFDSITGKVTSKVKGIRDAISGLFGPAREAPRGNFLEVMAQRIKESKEDPLLQKSNFIKDTILDATGFSIGEIENAEGLGIQIDKVLGNAEGQTKVLDLIFDRSGAKARLNMLLIQNALISFGQAIIHPIKTISEGFSKAFNSTERAFDTGMFAIGIKNFAESLRNLSIASIVMTHYKESLRALTMTFGSSIRGTLAVLGLVVMGIMQLPGLFGHVLATLKVVGEYVGEILGGIWEGFALTDIGEAVKDSFKSVKDFGADLLDAMGLERLKDGFRSVKEAMENIFGDFSGTVGITSLVALGSALAMVVWRTGALGIAFKQVSLGATALMTGNSLLTRSLRGVASGFFLWISVFNLLPDLMRFAAKFLPEEMATIVKDAAEELSDFPILIKDLFLKGFKNLEDIEWGEVGTNIAEQLSKALQKGAEAQGWVDDQGQKIWEKLMNFDGRSALANIKGKLRSLYQGIVSLVKGIFSVITFPAKIFQFDANVILAAASALGLLFIKGFRDGLLRAAKVTIGLGILLPMFDSGSMRRVVYGYASGIVGILFEALGKEFESVGWDEMNSRVLDKILTPPKEGDTMVGNYIRKVGNIMKNIGATLILSVMDNLGFSEETGNWVAEQFSGSIGGGLVLGAAMLLSGTARGVIFGSLKALFGAKMMKMAFEHWGDTTEDGMKHFARGIRGSVIRLIGVAGGMLGYGIGQHIADRMDLSGVERMFTVGLSTLLGFILPQMFGTALFGMMATRWAAVMARFATFGASSFGQVLGRIFSLKGAALAGGTFLTLDGLFGGMTGLSEQMEKGLFAAISIGLAGASRFMPDLLGRWWRQVGLYMSISLYGMLAPLGAALQRQLTTTLGRAFLNAGPALGSLIGGVFRGLNLGSVIGMIIGQNLQDASIGDIIQRVLYATVAGMVLGAGWKKSLALSVVYAIIEAWNNPEIQNAVSGLEGILQGFLNEMGFDVELSGFTNNIGMTITDALSENKLGSFILKNWQTVLPAMLSSAVRKMSFPALGAALLDGLAKSFVGDSNLPAELQAELDDVFSDATLAMGVAGTVGTAVGGPFVGIGMGIAAGIITGMMSYFNSGLPGSMVSDAIGNMVAKGLRGTMGDTVADAMLRAGNLMNSGKDGPVNDYELAIQPYIDQDYITPEIEATAKAAMEALQATLDRRSDGYAGLEVFDSMVANLATTRAAIEGFTNDIGAMNAAADLAASRIAGLGENLAARPATSDRQSDRANDVLGEIQPKVSPDAFADLVQQALDAKLEIEQVFIDALDTTSITTGLETSVSVADMTPDTSPITNAFGQMFGDLATRSIAEGAGFARNLTDPLPPAMQGAADSAINMVETSLNSNAQRLGQDFANTLVTGIKGVFGSTTIAAPTISAPKLSYGATTSKAPPAGGRPSEFSTGGSVFGPGTGTSDSIPALLSNGEFVINAKDTSKNLALLKAINTGKDISRFAAGGMAGQRRQVVQRFKTGTDEPAKAKYSYTEDFEGPAAGWADWISDKSTKAAEALRQTVETGAANLLRINREGNDSASDTRKNTSGITDAVEKSKKDAANSGKKIVDAIEKEKELKPLNATDAAAAEMKEQTDLLKGIQDALLQQTGSGRIRLADKIVTTIDQYGEEQKSIEPQYQYTGMMNEVDFAQAGADGAQEMLNGFKTQMSGFLSGDLSFGDAIDGFLDQLTNGIINSFVNSFSNSMFGPGGLNLSSMFSGLFGGMSSQGASSGLGASGIIGTIGGFLGFADGGPISGQGGPRSDDIPAMLSNGEYVINASATRKNRDLLDAINSGRRPAGFANGGLVGPAAFKAAAVGTMADMASMVSGSQAGGSASAQPASQTTVNLGITGDVSDATRQQLRRMIPELVSQMDSYKRNRNK
jgi:tape measure domain-containing protein